MADSTRPPEGDSAEKRATRAEYYRQYYQANRERIARRQKEYAQKNADRLRESSRKRYLANKARCQATNKRAAQKRIESDRKRVKAWRAQNKDRVRAYNLRYVMKKLATDPLYWLKQRVRVRLCSVISPNSKTPKGRTIAYVGCDVLTLKRHIESQFKDGMCWENRGQWHIDHIIPLALFDLRDKDQQLAAFHYTNLRPMWASENVRKGAKPPAPQHLFGFAYAAKIADGMISMRQVGRRKDGTRQHGHD
jgi:hypothetical protein